MTHRIMGYESLRSLSIDDLLFFGIHSCVQGTWSVKAKQLQSLTQDDLKAAQREVIVQVTLMSGYGLTRS